MKKIFSIYLLLLFIPVTLLIEGYSPGAHTLIFITSAIAIVPVARLISAATENLTHYTGQAVGGLLNASFGNLPELIITIMALRAGLYDMVLAALIGGILANLLLALGISFFVGGLKHHTQDFNPVTSGVYSSMMLIAVVSMIAPSCFDRLFADQALLRQEHLLNLGLAVILLFTYGLYLLFMLKTHPDFFKSSGHDGGDGEKEPWSPGRAVALLVLASLGAAWMSEILVGSAEATGKSLGLTNTFIGVVVLAILGGAAESLSAISMAAKNKMDLTLAITLGSCIQIALLIAPVTVLASYFIGPHPLNLSFGRVELGALFLAILMGIVVASDGKSHWYEGVQLTMVYLILAFLFFVMPASSLG